MSTRAVIVSVSIAAVLVWLCWPVIELYGVLGLKYLERWGM